MKSIDDLRSAVESADKACVELHAQRKAITHTLRDARRQRNLLRARLVASEAAGTLVDIVESKDAQPA